eukprot:scaffold2516_cov108-Isochrysis_galbana.AAC.6
MAYTDTDRHTDGRQTGRKSEDRDDYADKRQDTRHNKDTRYPTPPIPVVSHLHAGLPHPRTTTPAPPRLIAYLL